MSMFCFQCQETHNNTGCTRGGMCGKSVSTANLQDVLMERLKEIAVAAEQSGMIDESETLDEVGLFLAQSMFITITNANFDDAAIQAQVDKALAWKKRLGVSVPDAPRGVLATENEDVRSLRELLIYGMKGVSAYTDHAAVLGKTDPAIFRFLINGLSATTQELTADELTAMVLECGNIAVAAMKLLDGANTSAYGNPEITKVKLGTGTRPGILISGHDLRDMKDLLEQTLDAGVDVYTHSEMLPAHYYPEFKKYSHLVGHYGGSWWHQNQEFASFNGPILMTTNCITPVRGEYKDRIFTTGMAGFAGVKHIPDRVNGQPKDFSEIVALAKTCPPPTELETGEITGGFAHAQTLALAEKVIAAVKTGAIKRFVVMAGCDGRHPSREYFTHVAEKLPQDAVILTAGCAKYRYLKLPLGDIGGIPRVLDAGQCNDSYSLAVIALALKDAFGLDDVNKLPLSFDIAWYEQKAVAVLLALLALGFKNIRLGPTLPAFLSPAVATVLVKTFDIKPITAPDADVAAMMAGK